MYPELALKLHQQSEAHLVRELEYRRTVRTRAATGATRRGSTVRTFVSRARSFASRIAAARSEAANAAPVCCPA